MLEIYPYRIAIGPDKRPHCYYVTRADNGQRSEKYISWNGKGTILANLDVFANWLTPPDIGDEFEVDRHHLVIIRRDWIGNTCICMEASIPAHRLAIWYLIEKTRQRVHWNLFHAQFDTDTLQRAYAETSLIIE